MKSTKEIQSNSVAQTEEILERHEKNLNALDKKKKPYTGMSKFIVLNT